MTKIKQSKFRMSRSLGHTVHGLPKDAVNKRNYRPGQHGNGGFASRGSEFKIALNAKKSFKIYYNITESQLRATYKKADQMKGDSSENLIALLNSRLDGVLFVSNFAPSIYSACQLISHGHVLVNGKSVKIRSFRLSPGDVVTLSEQAKTFPFVSESAQRKLNVCPHYITVNTDTFSIGYVKYPILAEVPYPFKAEPNLVIEFYSR